MKPAGHRQCARTWLVLGKHALLAMACVVSLSACSKTSQLSESERGLLLTESDFAAFGLEHYAGTPRGRFDRIENYIGRTLDFTYQFQAPDQTFFIMSTVSDTYSGVNARLTAETQRGAMLVGLKIAGVKERPIELQNNYGSKAGLTLLLMKDEPVGNLFYTVIDDKAVVICFTGVYFDSAAPFEELIASQAQAVTRLGR